MFPGLTELRLIGCLIGLIWIPKIQIKHVGIKNQLADMLTKGKFTRDEWNHLLCLFNIGHFSSTDCSGVMSKRTQEESSEERVTAKSRPMMSLISQAPSTLSSSASESSGKRSYESQSPSSAKAEREDRRGEPVVGSDPKTASNYYHEQSVESSFSARYSKWDDNQAWSSQEWKTYTSMCDRSGQPIVTSWRKTRESQSSFFHEKTQHDGTAQSIVNEVIPRDRSGQPVVIPQRGARPQQFIIGNDETEWSVFMGRNYSDNQHSIANTKDLTLKQMFDISTRLVSEQDEISGLETIGCENHSWKYLSLIGEERIINLQRTKVHVFSDSVLCLGKLHENPQSNDAWEQRLGWLKSSSKLQKLWQNRRRAHGIRVEYSPRIQYVAAQWRSQKFTVEIRRDTRNFHRKYFFMSMFNDISCGTKDNEEECLANARLVSLYAKRFGKGQWSFIGPGSEKKWYCISEDSPQREWDNMAEKMMLTFAESGCPIFRATSPLSRGRLKSKGHGKLSIHYEADLETITTIFRTIVAANQLSLYGAVAEMCAEYETLHDRSGQPLSEGNEVPHSCQARDQDRSTFGLWWNG